MKSQQLKLTIEQTINRCIGKFLFRIIIQFKYKIEMVREERATGEGGKGKRQKMRERNKGEINVVDTKPFLGEIGETVNWRIRKCMGEIGPVKINKVIQYMYRYKDIENRPWESIHTPPPPPPPWPRICLRHVGYGCSDLATFFLEGGGGWGVQGKQSRQENKFSKVREITEEGKAAGTEDSIPFQTLPLFDVSHPHASVVGPKLHPYKGILPPLDHLSHPQQHSLVLIKVITQQIQRCLKMGYGIYMSLELVLFTRRLSAIAKEILKALAKHSKTMAIAGPRKNCSVARLKLFLNLYWFYAEINQWIPFLFDPPFVHLNHVPNLHLLFLVPPMFRHLQGDKSKRTR